MVEIESESTLSNLSEMCEFETIPSIDVGLIAHFFLIFFHQHHPKIDLVLAIVVHALKILMNFKGFIKNNVTKLVFAVFHAWIVWVSIILWCISIMIFAGEDTFWCCFTILQYKQLGTKRSMPLVIFHLLDCDAITFLAYLSC